MPIDKVSIASGSTPDIGNSAFPVTKETSSYEAGVGGIQLVDTIGTNVAAVVPLSIIEGHHVHFIVLLTNLRWRLELAEVMNKIRWTNATCGILQEDQSVESNVSVYVSHLLKLNRDQMANPPPCVDPDQLKNLEALHFKSVPERSSPAPLPSASTTQQSNGASSSSSAVAKSSHKVKQPHTLLKQWFGNWAPTRPFLLLHDCWQSMGWILPTQRPMKQSDWLQLGDQSDVIALRQAGEKLLEFHLHAMHPDAAGLVESLVGNEQLKAVVAKVTGLKEHIEKLYVSRSPEDSLTDEKYADYIEALFFKLLATPTKAPAAAAAGAATAKMAKDNRSCVVALLKAVIGTE